MLVIHRKMFEGYDHWHNKHCWCDPTYIEETVEIRDENGTLETLNPERTDIVVDQPAPAPQYLN